MGVRVVNGGLIAVLIFNYIITVLLMSVVMGDIMIGACIVFFIYVFMLGSVFTPLGDWYYRNIALDIRVPDMTERENVYRIFNTVYMQAKRLVPGLPDDIKLFVYDDPVPNAFAVGAKTVVLHSGLLYNNLYDEEIAAIIAHEMAHIANGDTVCTLLVLQSNVLLHICRTMFIFFLKLSAKVAGVVIWICSYIVGSKNAFSWGKFGNNVVMLLNDLSEKGLTMFMYGTTMIAQASRRRHELMADEFCFQLGFGVYLLQFFRRYVNFEAEQDKYSMAYLLSGTHPPMKDRIENLLRLIENGNRVEC